MRSGMLIEPYSDIVHGTHGSLVSGQKVYLGDCPADFSISWGMAEKFEGIGVIALTRGLTGD
jgi:hypothetical protein